MTPEEAKAIQDAIDGIDNAMDWMDAEMRRLNAAIDAGVELETIGAIYAAMRRYGD